MRFWTVHWLTGLVALLGCGGNAPAPAASSMLHDDFGEAITLPASPPTRIVSLNPTTTEILFALGAGGRLAGRSAYDEWPEAAQRVPSLGPALRPNVEALLQARPDLVLLYASADNRAAADALRRAGVRTVALKIDRIEEFQRSARVVGRLIGAPARADSLVDSVSATLARVGRVVDGLPRPTVLIPVYLNPLLVIGGGSFMSQLVAIAGGRNVFDSLAAASPAVTLEEVVRRDPDIILTAPEMAATIRGDARWRPLRAVRAGRVLVEDTVLMTRPSVRLGEAAVWLSGILHPPRRHDRAMAGAP